MSVDKAFLSGIVIEPLDARHDRAAFSCGETRIDNYLKISARSHVKEDLVQMYVAVRGDVQVLGYYALGAHALDTSSLPPEILKKMPPWPAISAFYLSMVGVDTRFQGKGLGTLLVADAFKKCITAADLVGGSFIVLDALNDDAARMYRRLGFTELPSQPRRMIIGMKQVRSAARKAP